MPYQQNDTNLMVVNGVYNSMTEEFQKSMTFHALGHPFPVSLGTLHRANGPERLSPKYIICKENIRPIIWYLFIA